MIEAHLPVRMWENSTIMELDSSVGLTVAPASVRCWLMIRRFCMSGVSRHSGKLATSAQVTCLAIGHIAGLAM
jgi:hypothetical protein